MLTDVIQVSRSCVSNYVRFIVCFSKVCTGKLVIAVLHRHRLVWGMKEVSKSKFIFRIRLSGNALKV